MLQFRPAFGCNLFPLPVWWPGQVRCLAGASRARWASCGPGFLQRLTRLTRYQMSVVHQQASKYTNTHKNTHSYSSGLSRSQIHIHSHRHSVVCHKKSIRKRSNPPVSFQSEMLNMFSLHFSPSGMSSKSCTTWWYTAPKSSHKCHRV